MTAKAMSRQHCQHAGRTNDLLMVVERERKRLRLDLLPEKAKDVDQNVGQESATTSLDAIITMEHSSIFASLQASSLGVVTRGINNNNKSLSNASFVVPNLIHIKNDGSSDEDELDDDDESSGASNNINAPPSMSLGRRKRSPLPYQSFEWKLPQQSPTVRAGNHWMKLSRPLAAPPRLPTRTEAAQLFPSLKT
jgi:hypothetical protein